MQVWQLIAELMDVPGKTEVFVVVGGGGVEPLKSTETKEEGDDFYIELTPE